VPRPKKPAGTTADKRNGRRAELDRVAGERFDPPDGLCELAQQQWEAYWSDAVASVQTRADHALLVRWIKNVDRYTRLIAEADAEPLTSNSQGHVANPLYAVALKVEASIKADEAQLGIGPKNRSALGIAVISERRSLADMNARYGGGQDNGGSGQDAKQQDEDPRLTVIEAG
jgi:P27 family predicted phage terminase small subunit